MKAIKQLTAVLSCIAVAGSLMSTVALAEGETPTLYPVNIEDIAVASGYSADQGSDKYDEYSAQYSYSRIRLGGSYTAGVLNKITDTTKYQVADGGSAIVYNQLDDNSTARDTSVTFLRITLPKKVEETDTYTLTMTADGLGHTSRTGAMDIYAGIADTTTKVRNDDTVSVCGEKWTAINWKNRPVVSGVTSVATAVDTTRNKTASIELKDILLGKEGTVTIALLSKANDSNVQADSYFKDISIKTNAQAQAQAPVEPTYSDASKVTVDAAEGETKDAAGFTCSVTPKEGITSRSLTWKVSCQNYDDATFTVNAEITGTECVVGLLITEIPEGVSADSISAQVAVQ